MAFSGHQNSHIEVQVKASNSTSFNHRGGRGRGFSRGRSGHGSESDRHKGDYEQKRVPQDSQGHTRGDTHGSRGESHRGHGIHRGRSGYHTGRSGYHTQRDYSSKSDHPAINCKVQVIFDQPATRAENFSSHGRGSGRGGSRGGYEKPYQGPRSDHDTKSKPGSSFHKPDSGRHQSGGIGQYRGRGQSRGRGHTGHHGGGGNYTAVITVSGSTKGGPTRKR